MLCRRHIVIFLTILAICLACISIGRHFFILLIHKFSLVKIIPMYNFTTLSNIAITQQDPIFRHLPKNDINTLIDIKDFKFTMNHQICNKNEPFLLILIHSSPINVRKRNVIRQTWGKKKISTHTLFLVGYSEKHNLELEKENIKFNDLIQGNFLDVYRNITYKHVMALKWVTYNCPNVKYVLKSDDDIFVHIVALLTFLKEKIMPWGIHRFMLCDIIKVSKPNRSWRSKWHVSSNEYPNEEYPSYCAGWAILYSPDAIFFLYREAQKQPFFWIDDVHITGIIAKKINITQISISSMILSKYKMKSLLTILTRKQKFFFGPPNLTENTIRALHNVVSMNITSVL